MIKRQRLKAKIYEDQAEKLPPGTARDQLLRLAAEARATAVEHDLQEQLWTRLDRADPETE
ncbi:hypothetical protein ACO2Q0_20855 [Phenylobacterium sp. VNQ135]|uniref:hypothetical protein n=1 Tax=Phenylobacterium sp. VNQ135 TaxID=3400922 RepID=UPI003C08E2E4